MQRRICWLTVALLAGTVTHPLVSQQVDWRTRVDFFADNTEFFTPYRVGETIFGARVTSWLQAAPGERTAVRLGVTADRRWGSINFSDSLKPVVAFGYRAQHTEAILGTLESDRRHGLADAVMVSTRELTSPMEYGGQWREKRGVVKSDIWLNWQQLNTPTEREGFEMGAVLSVQPIPGLQLDGQHLWSHRGGQLYDAGVPVSNNRVTLLGASYSRPFGVLGTSSIQVQHLWSVGHLEPPVGDTRPEKGHGTLARVGISPKGWVELFALSWWGEDFSAAAGDANYGSTGHDPGFYRASRRYTEVGLLRRAEIEAGITLDVAARLHRIDHEQSIAFFNSAWELSYRAVVRVPIDLVVRKH